MRTNLKTIVRGLKLVAVAIMAISVAGCDDPQVYGSVGVSSAWGGSGGSSSPRMHGSISVGGRIR